MKIVLHGGPFDNAEIDVPDAPTEYVMPIYPTIWQLISFGVNRSTEYPVRKALYYRMGNTLDYGFNSILPWM